jgi:hypothetical protein
MPETMENSVRIALSELQRIEAARVADEAARKAEQARKEAERLRREREEREEAERHRLRVAEAEARLRLAEEVRAAEASGGCKLGICSLFSKRGLFIERDSRTPRFSTSYLPLMEAPAPLHREASTSRISHCSARSIRPTVGARWRV